MVQDLRLMEMSTYPAELAAAGARAAKLRQTFIGAIANRSPKIGPADRPNNLICGAMPMRGLSGKTLHTEGHQVSVSREAQ